MIVKLWKHAILIPSVIFEPAFGCSTLSSFLAYFWGAERLYYTKFQFEPYRELSGPKPSCEKKQENETKIQGAKSRLHHQSKMLQNMYYYVLGIICILNLCILCIFSIGTRNFSALLANTNRTTGLGILHTVIIPGSGFLGIC